MWLDEDLTLEGLGTGVAPARTRRRPGARVGAAPAWVRDRLATTPGRLVLVSILVVVGAVLFGAIATGAEQSRERAAQAARSQTEPLLVHAEDLYTALSDANATEATALLSRRRRTDGEAGLGTWPTFASRANALSALDARIGDVGEPRRSRLNTIADQLPVVQRTGRNRARQQPAGVPDRRRLPAPGGASCPRPACFRPPTGSTEPRRSACRRTTTPVARRRRWSRSPSRAP